MRIEDKNQKVRINEGIRAEQLRVIDVEKGNLGVMSRDEALTLAREAGLDLIEISPDAVPPIAKIMDYGKYQYETKKKIKEIKSRSKIVETKSVQVKVQTGEGDLLMKAKKASEWLAEGHRIKAELFLRGRVKYLSEDFHKERLQRFLDAVTEEYKIVDNFKKSPKGLMVTLEPTKSPSTRSKEPITRADSKSTNE